MPGGESSTQGEIPGTRCYPYEVSVERLSVGTMGSATLALAVWRPPASVMCQLLTDCAARIVIVSVACAQALRTTHPHNALPHTSR